MCECDILKKLLSRHRQLGTMRMWRYTSMHLLSELYMRLNIEKLINFLLIFMNFLVDTNIFRAITLINSFCCILALFFLDIF